MVTNVKNLTTSTEMVNKCLVLNSAYMPMQIIRTERAFAIWYKGNARIVYEHDVFFKTINPNLQYKKPSIILIDKWVNVHNKAVPLNRDNILKRDNHACVYCGFDKNRKELTLDHVIPKARGGKDSWDNLVTACKKCNNEKDCLTDEEWGRPIPQPYRPHWLMLMKSYSGEIPDEWKTYLFF